MPLQKEVRLFLSLVLLVVTVTYNQYRSANFKFINHHNQLIITFQRTQ